MFATHVKSPISPTSSPSSLTPPPPSSGPSPPPGVPRGKNNVNASASLPIALQKNQQAPQTPPRGPPASGSPVEEGVTRRFFPSAADRVQRAETRLEENEYDLDAWNLVIKEAQSRRIEESRPFYERLVTQFPNSGRFWKVYIEHEVRFLLVQTVIDALFIIVPKLFIIKTTQTNLSHKWLK